MTLMVEAEVEFDPKTNFETWEITTGGKVYVWVKDPREANGYRKQVIGGRQGGSRRITISTDDRRFNQDQVAWGNEGLDVFRNGMLRKVDQVHVDDVDLTNQYTSEQLSAIFSIRSEKKFLEKIEGITSELVLRRLFSVGEVEGTMAQVEALRNLIEVRYPIGGTQRAVKEFLEGELSGGDRLS